MNSVDLAGDILIQNIVVISGIRPYGRTVNMLKNGRQKHGFLYIWSGETTFYLDGGKTIKATGGQLLYLPKSIQYKMQYTAESTTLAVINFDLSKESIDIFSTREITVLKNSDPQHTIANIMAKFEVFGTSQNFAGQFRRKELFYRLLALIFDNNLNLESQHYPQIATGVMLLKQTYLENLPIEVFARQSDVSVSSFRQLFHKQFGMSPLQYRNLLRIQRAKQMLEYDNCTVAEIAYASGFENIGYFCRCYKKFTGETPRETKLRNSLL